MNARVTLPTVTLLTMLLGATPAAALPYIVNASLDACGGTPSTAATKVTMNRTPDDPLGSANCPALCARFVVACRGAVDASANCWKNTSAKFAAVAAATCNVQSGAAKDACNDLLKADRETVKVSYVVESRATGRDYWETTGLASCLATCD